MQALQPFNLFRRHLFWNSPYPTGIVGTPRALIVDTDEAAITLGMTNNPYGKAYTGFAVRDEGNFGADREKWTLIASVDSNDNVVITFQKSPGTTAEMFVNHIRKVIARYEVLTPGVQHTFMWDNLASHFSAAVHQIIHDAGHRWIPRPPYRCVLTFKAFACLLVRVCVCFLSVSVCGPDIAGQLCVRGPLVACRPEDGPIEYFFNQLEQELHRAFHRVNNETDLVREVNHISRNIRGMNATFQHCGY